MGPDRVPERRQPCLSSCLSTRGSAPMRRQLTEILGSKSHWSPQTPGRESERFQGERGSSSRGHEQGEARTGGRRRAATLQAAGRISDDLRRNQQGQGSGPVAQNCPSREGSALSAWETLQSYTQRSSTIQTCFLKNPSSSCMRRTDFDHKLLEGEEGG